MRSLKHKGKKLSIFVTILALALCISPFSVMAEDGEELAVETLPSEEVEQVEESDVPIETVMPEISPEPETGVVDQIEETAVPVVSQEPNVTEGPVETAVPEEVPELDQNMEEETATEEVKVSQPLVEEQPSVEQVPDEQTSSSSLPIEFTNGIHYIHDPEFNKKIVLFCMNNKMLWPHHTEGMGDTEVPLYDQGYLTPNDFGSQEDYDRCMEMLEDIMFIGYPYNSRGLYKIVDYAHKKEPTEDEFNRMLVPDQLLVKAFPYLGHHDFVYKDWQPDGKHNELHMAPLRRFIQDVMKLAIADGVTSNGLTYEDIVAFPFYKAAWCMVTETTETPLRNFADFYSTDYYVTEEQAYNATQLAVWYVLNEFGIEGNDISSLEINTLAGTLYKSAQRIKTLNYEPSEQEIRLVGDTNFRYEPKDGMWHSGKLRIIEPEEYDGIYYMELPPGVTALCDNLNFVYGNEEYELVSDHNPHLGDSFRVTATIPYLQAFKQYSPAEDVQVGGKSFQHMGGVVLAGKKLTMQYSYTPDEVGNLAITKEVIGENDQTKEFRFRVSVCANTVNGLYGDVSFTNGVGEFTLHPSETVNITNLPANIVYHVEELDSEGYDVTSEQASGMVRKNDTITIPFVNTLRPDLTIHKQVTGEMGDLTKAFRFEIHSKDKEGNPLVGTYTGSHIDASRQTTPQTVTFTNGIAEVQLKHGESFTIKDLPYGVKYTVVENAEDHAGYLTSYNGQAALAETTLDHDQEVMVVNNKEYVPDTGIDRTSHMMMFLMIALSSAGLLLLRHKRGGADER